LTAPKNEELKKKEEILPLAEILSGSSAKAPAMLASFESKLASYDEKG